MKIKCLETLAYVYSIGIIGMTIIVSKKLYEIDKLTR